MKWSVMATKLRRKNSMAKSVKLDANGYRKFGMRDKVAYAAGDFGCNMSFALKGTMALFWTQFMGMDLWYSLLLIIVQVWDAINAPPDRLHDRLRSPSAPSCSSSV